MTALTFSVEVITIPVSDVDRALRFYRDQLGFHLDVDYSDQVLAEMQANPHARQPNEDWTERAPVVHFVLDQDRLRLIGLSSNDAEQQIQFLTTGVTVTQVREDIRAVE